MQLPAGHIYGTLNDYKLPAERARHASPRLGKRRSRLELRVPERSRYSQLAHHLYPDGSDVTGTRHHQQTTVGQKRLKVKKVGEWVGGEVNGVGG